MLAAGAFAIGGVLGSGLTVALTDTRPVPTAAESRVETSGPASAGLRSDTLPGTADAAEHWLESDTSASGFVSSADAAERWAVEAQQERQALCTISPTSADALERCMASRADR